MIDLFSIAEKEKIPVEYAALPLNESIAVQENECEFIVLDHKFSSDSPETLTHLAHELGHCMTGSFYNIYSPLDVRKKHEYRANKWAVQSLITEEALDEAVAAGNTELWQLAEHFGVTEDFMKKAVCYYTYGNLAVDLYF